MPKKKSNFQIRWLIRRDMEEVLSIEKRCFWPLEWTEEDFLSNLRQRNCIGMVAERDRDVVGYMIYELQKGRLEVLNFAVDPDCQRQGIGTAMVHRMVEKLSLQRRKQILLYLSERNLNAQLFFRAMGFICTGQGHDFDNGDASYEFIFNLEWAKAVA